MNKQVTIPDKNRLINLLTNKISKTMEQTQVQAPVKAESAKSQFPTVIVTSIFAPLSGSTKGQNVQVKWITEKENSGARSLTSFFLGSMAQTNNEKRTALIFMENSVIESLKLDIGVNLNEAMKAVGEAPVRLSVSEISDEEYQLAKANGANMIGYQQKVNPSTGELMGYKNAPIWRKTFVDVVDGIDEYLASDGTTVTITSDDDVTV